MLVFLVLPNPLRVPQNNPTSSAEYAPVPGRQETSTDANFGETGQATSGGVGAGGQGEGILPGAPPPKLPPQFNPRGKQCVGTPPRQTEDPLSPFCVPYFDGNNGGTTYRGVTSDEITVVYYNDFNVEGEMNTPYATSQERGTQAHYYYQNHTKTVKALLRYFQRRYQTYGRRVRMIAHASDSGLGTGSSQRKGDALIIAGRLKPFSTAVLIENAQDFAPWMAERDTPVFGWNEDVPASAYEDSAPYFWSFMPDQETESKWSAAFICRKLKGRAAKFTSDPAVLGEERKFALIWPKTSQRGPFLEQLSALLIKNVKEQCGMTFDYAKPFAGNGDAPRLMATFRGDGITTIICYCIPQESELQVPAFQNAASGIGYFPEWYWDHASAMDRALWQRSYGSPQHRSFGVSYLWRQPAFRDSYAYQAFLSEEPQGVPNLRFNHEIYHVFLNLFSGIQAAGPNLNPETIKRGMFTFRYQNPQDPWVPTGGYGNGGPSPYTFVHSAMAWWYDPSGTPPDGREGEGCIRVLYEGRRFFGEAAAGRMWPEGDGDILLPSWPCSEDVRRQFEG